MNSGLKAGSASAFTIFGFTRELGKLSGRLTERLGIVPRTVDLGNAGHFFLHTSYGDVAETEQALALKLGFVRSPTESPLSAQQLLDQKIVTPQQIDTCAIRGNSLIACFSKIEPRCVAFKNLLSTPQLYYWASGGELIGSDNLGCLVAALDQVALNEEIIPFHFMFRQTTGTLTYFQDVHRLFPGQLITWREGNLSTRQAQDLRFQDNELVFERVTPQARAALYQKLRNVIGSYISEIEKAGYSLGNLLSGGVDSSIIQLMINEQVSSRPARSFSLALDDVPSFQFEVDYAREAGAMLGTHHTFAHLKPEDYPSRIPRAIEILGQPVYSTVEPGKLALAESLAEMAPDLRFVFVGQGGDTLFGLDIALKLKMLDLIRTIPGSPAILAGMGKLLKPFTVRSQTMLKGADILAHANDPRSFVAPTNTVGVYANLELARRCFGEETLWKVLEARNDLETQCLNSSNYTEKVQAIDLLTECYEVLVQSAQLFLANHIQQAYPYFDDDIVRMSFAFRPEIRYLDGFRTKPLLKDFLEQRGLSSIARKPKGGSTYTDQVFSWMRSGPMREMVQDIDRPGFLSKADFEQLVQTPNHFLWCLLTFDIFQKKFLSH